MTGAARFFDRFNHRVLDDPRHRLILNDARNYLELTDESFDVLVSEPTNPWIAGVGSLFTREYFDLTRSHLAPGGVISQWVQTYQYQEEDLRAVFRTFLDAYTDLHLWSGAPGDLIVVGSMEPLALEIGRVREALAGEPGADLAQVEILPLAQVLAHFVTDRAGIEAYVGNETRRVTDDNLYLEYAVPRHMFQVEGRVDVTTLERVTRPILPHLAGTGVDSALAADIARFREARRISLLAHVRGQMPPGARNPEEAFRMALAVAPGEQTASDYLSHELNEQGIVAMGSGDTLTAAGKFREAAAIGSRQERALALNNLGMLAFRRGEVDSAGRAWQAAREEEPDHPIVLFNLAIMASYEGRRRDAVALFRQVVGRQNDNESALNNLAYQLALLGEDLEEAERDARRAVALNPSLNNRDTLGFVLVKRGHWDEAKRVLGGVVAENPQAWESVYHLALAQAGEGDPGGARASLERVLQGSMDASLVEQARDALKKL
jgi:spermidine synthase